MANSQQLEVLHRGAAEWNRWRQEHPNTKIDLHSAELDSARLNGFDFSQADLSGARLRDAKLNQARLVSADLSGASLFAAAMMDCDARAANLIQADLSYAALDRAILSETRLHEARFQASRFERTDFASATFGATVLADVDLRECLNLETCQHQGPSVLSFDTLLRSDRVPRSFLVGCGLPETLIDYLPYLRSSGPIQFYSVFISYATANQAFVERLYQDLHAQGVSCWLALHHMEPGKRIWDQIDQAIKVYDRLLLVLSPESMSSRWVKSEIARARQKEVEQSRRVLFPVTLVPVDELKRWQQFDADLGEDLAKSVREYYIPDFSNWEYAESYNSQFAKLLKALRLA